MRMVIAALAALALTSAGAMFFFSKPMTPQEGIADRCMSEFRGDPQMQQGCIAANLQALASMPVPSNDNERRAFQGCKDHVESEYAFAARASCYETLLKVMR